jgi:hypothetical protein
LPCTLLLGLTPPGFILSPLRGCGAEDLPCTVVLGLTPPGYILPPLRGCGAEDLPCTVVLGLTPPGYRLPPLRGCGAEDLPRATLLGLTPQGYIRPPLRGLKPANLHRARVLSRPWSRTVLDQEARVENTRANRRDQQRLPQADFANQFRGDPKREDQEPKELENPADAVATHNKSQITNSKSQILAPAGLRTLPV